MRARVRQSSSHNSQSGRSVGGWVGGSASSHWVRLAAPRQSVCVCIKQQGRATTLGQQECRERGQRADKKRGAERPAERAQRPSAPGGRAPTGPAAGPSRRAVQPARKPPQCLCFLGERSCREEPWRAARRPPRQPPGRLSVAPTPCCRPRLGLPRARKPGEQAGCQPGASSARNPPAPPPPRIPTPHRRPPRCCCRRRAPQRAPRRWRCGALPPPWPR